MPLATPEIPNIIALLLLCIAIEAVRSEDLLDFTCLQTKQCKTFADVHVEANCVEGHCQCKTHGGESIECKPKTAKVSNIVGGPCPCNMQNTECEKPLDICYCSTNYIASVDRRRCIPKLIPLDTEACEQDMQCQLSDSFSKCSHITHKCVCQKGFIKQGNKCISVISNVSGSNTPCTNNTQCQKLHKHSHCDAETGFCFCALPYVASQNSSACLLESEYQAPCSEHIQCHTLGLGGKCNNGICVCAEKYFVIKGETVRCGQRAELGQYCRTDAECDQEELQEQTMECRYGECCCKWGYDSIDDGPCFKGSDAARANTIQKTLLIAVAMLLIYKLHL